MHHEHTDFFARLKRYFSNIVIILLFCLVDGMIIANYIHIKVVNAVRKRNADVTVKTFIYDSKEKGSPLLSGDIKSVEKIEIYSR